MLWNKTIPLRQYRVVKDRFLGFESQVWRLWWPFWVQIWEDGITNTHRTLKDAQELIEKHKVGSTYNSKGVGKVIWKDN